MSVWHHIAHWFLHYTGSDNVSGPEYGFWSGFGSDLSELALIAGLWAYLRKHNCPAKGCWRLARHPVGNTGYIVCRKHHPEGKPTVADIHAAHAFERRLAHTFGRKDRP